MSKTSLKSRIKSAKTEAEVADLLKEGKSYDFASVRTRNSWIHTSKKVISSFKGNTYVAPVEEQEFVEKKTKKQKVKKS